MEGAGWRRVLAAMAGWSHLRRRILLLVMVLPLSANEAGEAAPSSLVWASGGQGSAGLRTCCWPSIQRNTEREVHTTNRAGWGWDGGRQGGRDVAARGCGLAGLLPLSVSGAGDGGWGKHGAGQGERPRRVGGGPPVLRVGAVKHAAEADIRLPGEAGNLGMRGGAVTRAGSLGAMDSPEGPTPREDPRGRRGRPNGGKMRRGADIRAEKRDMLRASMPGDARR